MLLGVGLLGHVKQELWRCGASAAPGTGPAAQGEGAALPTRTQQLSSPAPFSSPTDPLHLQGAHCRQQRACREPEPQSRAKEESLQGGDERAQEERGQRHSHLWRKWFQRLSSGSGTKAELDRSPFLPDQFLESWENSGPGRAGSEGGSRHSGWACMGPLQPPSSPWAALRLQGVQLCLLASQPCRAHG